MHNKRLLFLFVILGISLISYLSGCDELVTERIEITLTDSTLGIGCFNCHSDTDNRFLRPKGQWENSKHASAAHLDTILTPGCDGAMCHTHEGYIVAFDQKSINNPEYSVIGCFTCHDPHSYEYDTWDDSLLTNLRGTNENGFDTLANDSIYFLFTEDKSIMCVNCHQDTKNISDPAGGQDNVTFTKDFGPHFSPQANVLAGFAGYSFNSTVPVTNHKDKLAELKLNGCFTCHFGKGRGYDFGQHTFRLADDDGFEYVTNCNITGCHSTALLTDFSTDMIKSMADSLQSLFKQLTVFDDNLNIRTDTAFSADIARMLYNYLLYKRDGSYGVHNPEYMSVLLTESVERLDSLPVSVTFMADTIIVLVNDTITFTYQASLNIDSLLWNFGDTSYVAGDDGASQKHAYNTAGSYTVSLTAYGKDISNVFTYTLPDQISVYNGLPVAGFTPSTVDTLVDALITFTNTSTDADSYLWDFGDSQTSTASDPTHSYPTPGTYDIQLIATNPFGKDTANVSINIQ